MKEKFLSIFFTLYLSCFLVLNIFAKDQDISKSERRKLKQLPNISMSNVMDSSFMKDFDSYALDQFVFRDQFRSIKANVNYKVLKKLDNNGIYVIDDYIFKSEYPTNINSIDNFINKINSIGNYFKESNKVYYSIIPDKNYYLNSDNYLNIDYDLLYSKINTINYEYIELRDILNLDDYYKTDTHWRQENLCKVVNRLGENLKFKTSCDYKEEIYNEFYGVYYGQSALNLKPDSLIYLVNDIILNSDVYYLENKDKTSVYIPSYLNNLDGYDIYLSGASSYIEINNKANNSGRELIIFRDSFASSLAPLLIEFYSKITLVDIRYINSDNYLKLIKFDNQDILFLYSTLIVNNSGILK